MADVKDFPICPEDGGEWKYYDGALGYESLICPICNLDINDLEVISAKLYSVKVVRERKWPHESRIN